MNWLIEPLRYGFMQSAALAAALVAVTCASLGVYVVLRRMAFIGDALAHTVLPGLVIAYLNSWNLFGGAIIAGAVTSLAIGWLSERQEVREDSAIGILFTGMFAIGILLISTVRSFKDFTHMLFGYILGVTDQQLIIIAVIAVAVLGTLALFHKELELTSFDPTHAQVIGLRPGWMRYLLLLLMALAVVSAIQAVGVVLTSALLVVPAAAAALLTHRLIKMMLLAVIFALVASLAGLYASFYLDLASGASIVLACIVCFLGAWVWRLIRQRLAHASEQA